MSNTYTDAEWAAIRRLFEETDIHWLDALMENGCECFDRKQMRNAEDILEEDDLFNGRRHDQFAVAEAAEIVAAHDNAHAVFKIITARSRAMHQAAE